MNTINNHCSRFGSQVGIEAYKVGSSAVRTAKRVGAGVGLLVGSAAVSFAQATPVDYGAVLNTNLDTIDGIWGTVATIMIAVALVTVGVRFFRKAK